MADAICMGELQINFVPVAAGTNLLTVFHKAPDGAPANVAVSLARPGFESALISPSMSRSATRQPLARKRFAVARPMPRAAPVTSATFCASSVISASDSQDDVDPRFD